MSLLHRCIVCYAIYLISFRLVCILFQYHSAVYFSNDDICHKFNVFTVIIITLAIRRISDYCYYIIVATTLLAMIKDV